MATAKEKIQNFLLNRKLISESDNVNVVRPDFDSPHYIMVNSQKFGQCDVEPKFGTFTNLKVYHQKPKGVRQQRKEMWQKKEYTIADWLRAKGKIQIQG